MWLFTADKSYLGACGWLQETDKLTEGDGCVTVHRKMNKIKGSGRVRLSFAVCHFEKCVCAEHPVFKYILGEHNHASSDNASVGKSFH